MTKKQVDEEDEEPEVVELTKVSPFALIADKILQTCQLGQFGIGRDELLLICKCVVASLLLLIFSWFVRRSFKAKKQEMIVANLSAAKRFKSI